MVRVESEPWSALAPPQEEEMPKQEIHLLYQVPFAAKIDKVLHVLHISTRGPAAFC